MRLALGVQLAALIVAACSAAPAAERPDAPDPQGSLTTFLVVDPAHIDPQRAGFVDEGKIALMVYEGLLRLDTRTLRPAPAAADMPAVSADGRAYRFKIRRGQTYSDGSPLTARDFAYGLSRLCDPQLAAPYAAPAFVIVGCEQWASLDPATATPQGLKAARDALFERGLKVSGDHELEISLTRPAAYLPSFLALWVSAPVRERDVQRGGDNWSVDPDRYIGNGPFVLSERIIDDRLVFVANKKARVAPKLARWTIRVAPPVLSPAEWEAKRVEAYRRDEGDVVALGVGSVRALVDQDERLKAELSEFPAACTDYVRFDTARPPFDDPKVRLALAKSIDRDALVRVEGLRSRPAVSFIAPGIPGHDPADDAQRYDVEPARRLLAESAYGAGRFPATPWPYRAPRQKVINEWLAAQWKEHLGIEVRPQLVPLTAYAELQRSVETSPRLIGLGWCADYPDQQNWLSTLFHSTSRSQPGTCDPTAVRCRPWYTSRAFDRLVEQADAPSDQTRRDDLYRQASRLLSAEAPAVWLTYHTKSVLTKGWVRGLNTNAIDAGGVFHPEDVYVVKRRR